MNWVAPIKDEATLEKFKTTLKAVDDKYYILFEIGIGTGLQLQEMLEFRNKDVRGKDEIVVKIGKKQVSHIFKIPESLKELINDYTEGKDPDAYLLLGYPGQENPLSREQVYRVFKSVGNELGLNSIGAQTMRKTFAWKYYKKCGDIYYLQELFNHGSPSITYRYIGEKPNTELILKKMSAEENERSRYYLNKDGNGKKRLGQMIDLFTNLQTELDNPNNNDAFYGRVDCFLAETEELVRNFNNTQ